MAIVVKKSTPAPTAKPAKKAPTETPRPIPPIFNLELKHEDIWGVAYQTDNDETKKTNFKSLVKRWQNNVDPLVENIIRQTIIDVFFNETKQRADEDTDLGKLQNIMVDIAIVESNGFQDLDQIGGGPASGVHQVEPKTVKSLTKNSALIGTKVKELLLEQGFDTNASYSKKQLQDFLKDPVISTIFATAQLLSGAKENNVLEGLR